MRTNLWINIKILETYIQINIFYDIFLLSIYHHIIINKKISYSLIFNDYLWFFMYNYFQYNILIRIWLYKYIKNETYYNSIRFCSKTKSHSSQTKI